MTIEERTTAFTELQKEIDAICRTKSTDYAGKTDILLNFKMVAERAGLTKFQVWAVYFEKHVSAITNAIKHNPEDPRVESEPLETRVYDAINYLRLFHCLRLEDKAKRQKKKLKTGTEPQCDQSPTSSETSTRPSNYPYTQNQDCPIKPDVNCEKG